LFPKFFWFAVSEMTVALVAAQAAATLNKLVFWFYGTASR
jgi:hypothetical protein